MTGENKYLVPLTIKQLQELRVLITTEQTRVGSLDTPGLIELQARINKLNDLLQAIDQNNHFEIANSGK